MNNPDTLITDADHRRLRSLVARLRSRGGPLYKDRIATVSARLRRSRIVSPRDIPRNVVTLNSRVSLKDLDSGKRIVCTLADPSDLALFGDRLSVAATPGAALLGKRVGQVVRWPGGASTRRLRIEQVLYQPEAAGDFHL